MPKNEDIKSVLVIGSGPIKIGQAGEFDYSGTQACKSLKEEGLTVILVNPNPASVMTDPDVADYTYIEPIDVCFLTEIIKKHKPDALLPTVGGQTALNMALRLEEEGVLKEFSVKLIGAKPDVIENAENRSSFNKILAELELQAPPNVTVSSWQEAKNALEYIGLPAIVRPSFTLGGTGGGIAYTEDQYETFVQNGLKASPTNEVQIDKSLIGWKEFELEVVRDCKDNCIIVCSIENVDPMGIHTGDSITVAPAMTLRDIEFQAMRDASFKIIRRIGLEAGGANVQFALDPNNSDNLYVIEMNPRVSRSSALASKATGFPIAKIAAKLAIGLSLDELKNDCADILPASFEPSLDYVVVKIPKFHFSKFPKVIDRCENYILSTAMKSVGEIMTIGSSFKQAFQKALYASEEKKYDGIDVIGLDMYDDLCSDFLHNMQHKTDPSQIRVNRDLTYVESYNYGSEPFAKFIDAFIYSYRHILSQQRADRPFWITTALFSYRRYIENVKFKAQKLVNNDSGKISYEKLKILSVNIEDAKDINLNKDIEDIISFIVYLLCPQHVDNVNDKPDNYVLDDSKYEPKLREEIRKEKGTYLYIEDEYFTDPLKYGVYDFRTGAREEHTKQENVKEIRKHVSKSKQYTSACDLLNRIYNALKCDEIDVDLLVKFIDELVEEKLLSIVVLIINNITHYDSWFIYQMNDILSEEINWSHYRNGDFYNGFYKSNVSNKLIYFQNIKKHFESILYSTKSEEEFREKYLEIYRECVNDSHFNEYCFKAYGIDISSVVYIARNKEGFISDEDTISKINRSIENDDIIDKKIHNFNKGVICHYKNIGFSDAKIAEMSLSKVDRIEEYNISESLLKTFEVMLYRLENKIRPIFKRIDTCAGEFPSSSSYMYSSYECDNLNNSESTYCESNPDNTKRKIMVLGSGPIRIGQGIEFDYMCVHSCYTIKNTDGLQAIMVNSNPSTVSTDYDTSDKLYVEPMTIEHIFNIICVECENSSDPIEIIWTIGGQTALKLAEQLDYFQKFLKSKGRKPMNFKLVGTPIDSLHLTEDRKLFSELVTRLNLKQPKNMLCDDLSLLLKAMDCMNFPLLIRPSYVIGGESMLVINNKDEFWDYITHYIPLKNDTLLDSYGVSFGEDNFSSISKIDRISKADSILRQGGFKFPIKIGNIRLVDNSDQHEYVDDRAHTVYNFRELLEYFISIDSRYGEIENSYLVDEFLQNAIEVDVDAVVDSKGDVFIAGMVEHIEEAGIHSGDSSCSIPPYSLSDDQINSLEEQTILLAKELKIVGLVNVQFAISNSTIYILEINPRASRTIPFIAKATKKSIVNIAVNIMVNNVFLSDILSDDYKIPFSERKPELYAVKSSFFPFDKFPEADSVLSPEMKSTGEVMSFGNSFEEAFSKAQIAINNFPNISKKKLNIFISIKDDDKQVKEGHYEPYIVSLLKELEEVFKCNFFATSGTANCLSSYGISKDKIKTVERNPEKVIEVLEQEGDLDLIINTPSLSRDSARAGVHIRRKAISTNIPYVTTIATARAMIKSIISKNKILSNNIFSLQEDI